MSDDLHKRDTSQDIPEIDEEWWNSVLADEESFVSANKEINCRPCGIKINDSIDWICVQRIFEQDEVVLMQVSGFNRGGLLVQNDNIQGFVPVSHLVDFSQDCSEDEKQIKLEGYLDRSLYLKVIECEPENDRIVFSERAAQAGEGKRKELFNTLEQGTVVCGVVTNTTDFGAFVDLGGVEGLIHVSEISWGRVNDPANILKVGQVVRVVILQVNEANARIALSMKRLEPNPWDQITQSYQPGDVIEAEVTSIARFGMFARLEEGIEGLIHISSLPEETRVKDITERFSSGQHVKVRILHVDTERRRLGLGLVIKE